MKRSKKIKDLTRSAHTKRKPDEQPLEAGRVVTPYKPGVTKEGVTRRSIEGPAAHFRKLNRRIAEEKRRFEDKEEKRTLPLRMKSLARRLGRTPFGKWTAKDMQLAQELLNPEIVMLLSEKAKKLE